MVKKIFHSFILLSLMLLQMQPVFAASTQKIGANGEIIGERGYNTKIYDLGMGKKKAVVHQKWVHYLDEEGGWQDIDTSLTDVGNSFVMDSAPFSFRAPKFADGQAVFTSTNRYDVTSKSVIHEAPFSATLQALGVQNVAGHIETFTSTWVVDRTDVKTINDAVIYGGAYDAVVKGDLIYWVNFGRVPRMEKLVRINENPNPVEDIQLSFKISYSEAVSILGIENFSTSFSHGIIAKPSDRGGEVKQLVGLRDFYIWDSSRDAQKLKINVKLDQNSDGSYTLTKFLPKSFFANAVYPVYTDATYYSAAGDGSTTIDGHVFKSLDTTFSGVRDDETDNCASAPNSVDTNINAGYILYNGTVGGAHYRYISRTLFTFDTSGITGANQVDSGNFTVQTHPWGVVDDSDPVRNLNVSSVTRTDSGAIICNDYDISHYGSTPLSTDLASNAIDSPHVFTLNASGLAAVNVTGITGLSIRFADDINNVTNNHPGDSFEQKFWPINSADNSGTDSDPVLTLVYSAVAPSTPEFSDVVYLSTLALVGWFIYSKSKYLMGNLPPSIGA